MQIYAQYEINYITQQRLTLLFSIITNSDFVMVTQTEIKD